MQKAACSEGPGLAQECLSWPLVESVASSSDCLDWVASAPGHGSAVRCPRGEARLTSGHLLQCKHVIHAVGCSAAKRRNKGEHTLESFEHHDSQEPLIYLFSHSVTNRLLPHVPALPALLVLCEDVCSGPDYDTAVRCAGSAKSTAEAHLKAEQQLADTYWSIFALANAASGLQI